MHLWYHYFVTLFFSLLFCYFAILLFCSPNKRSKWQTLLGNIRRLIGNKHIDNLTKGCSSEKKSATALYWTWFLHWCIGKSYWLKHVDNWTKGFRWKYERSVYTQYVHHLGLISFVGLCLQKEQHEAILATNRLTTQQKAGESFS